MEGKTWILEGNGQRTGQDVAFQGQPAQSTLVRNLDFILKVRKTPEELLSNDVK